MADIWEMDSTHVSKSPKGQSYVKLRIFKCGKKRKKYKPFVVEAM